MKEQTVDIPVVGLHGKRQMWDAELSLDTLIRSLEVNKYVASKTAERATEQLNDAELYSPSYWEARMQKLESERHLETYIQLLAQAADTKKKLQTALKSER
ncbi:hypothetical protein GI364_11185 [Alicyclobacillus sp. SO9]|nr:hypothetical protein GI364_11185 [Alicyclobacillus sp. SO9]